MFEAMSEDKERKTAKNPREQRLADALRANLRRRKAQARDLRDQPQQEER